MSHPAYCGGRDRGVASFRFSRKLKPVAVLPGRVTTPLWRDRALAIPKSTITAWPPAPTLPASVINDSQFVPPLIRRMVALSWHWSISRSAAPSSSAQRPVTSICVERRSRCSLEPAGGGASQFRRRLEHRRVHLIVLYTYNRHDLLRIRGANAEPR